jgi:integrase/recombinase XerD
MEDSVAKKKTIIFPDYNPPDNYKLIDEYLLDIGCTNLTANTVLNYSSCLKEFNGFFDKSLMDVDISDLKRFKIYIENKKNRYNKTFKSSTLSRYFTAIESFYEFLEFEELIDKSPMPKFRRRYLKDYKKKNYTGNSRRKIISVEDMSTLVNSIMDPRDKAVVVLLAKTGIRRRELINLDIDDINMFEQSIHLKPTRKRTNLDVFFDDECARILKRWLVSRSNRKNIGTKALFLNERGGRLGRNAIYELFVKYATRIGLHNPNSHQIQDRFTPHCTRHWYTTWLLRNGMRRECVKELRGDARQEAIDIYHHIDRKDLRDSYLACIPQLGIG